MTITAYPLSWPPQFPRAKAREKGRFSTTLAGALKNVQSSLDLFAKDSGKKLDSLIISSNVTLGAHKPADAGVAVWFSWDGLQVCIAVDRYSSVEGNLQAIHHIIEARRVELRHGTLALVRATFQGFLALVRASAVGEILMALFPSRWGCLPVRRPRPATTATPRAPRPPSSTSVISATRCPVTSDGSKPTDR